MELEIPGIIIASSGVSAVELGTLRLPSAELLCRATNGVYPLLSRVSVERRSPCFGGRAVGENRKMTVDGANISEGERRRDAFLVVQVIRSGQHVSPPQPRCDEGEGGGPMDGSRADGGLAFAEVG